MTANASHLQARPRRARAILALVLIAAVIVAGNAASEWLRELLDIRVLPSNEHVVHRLVMIAAAAYVVLIAIPFVPGVEIALSLIMVFGAKVVLLMYVCTFAGLALAFVAGRLVPTRLLQRLMLDLSLRRAAAFLGRVQGMSEAERLDLLAARAPSRLVPVLLRYRYVALALALNVPGNVVIGGGGGIVLLAGISRLFAPAAFFVTLAIAISPVPLAVALLGTGVLVG